MGLFSSVERDTRHTLPPVISSLPTPPPRRIGEAPTPPSRKPPPPIPPDRLTPTQAGSRTGLTTISIPQWPIDYETEHPRCNIGKLRSHYGDLHHPLCDRVLVKFSRNMSTILRHDTKDFKDVWVTSVDKSNWPHGIIWPIEDLCRYLGRILHFTRLFGSWEFKEVFLHCMPDCPMLDYIVSQRDWETIGIPKNFALKWLAICAFEKPRIAKLCSTTIRTIWH